MTAYVLVSGAWHAGLCWERVVPLLEARRRHVLAPDLIGMGPDAARFAQASVEIWVNQLVTLVDGEDDPVVLLGHSRGGLLVSQVAERIPDRIARAVYLAPFLLAPGHSIARTSGSSELGAVLEPVADGGLRVLPHFVGPLFYNTTPPAWVARAQQLLTAEPANVLVTPVSVSDARFGRVPRGYIECTEDRAVPHALQQDMQRRWPCERVVTLTTDHSPFYSDPAALTAALEVMA